MQGSASSASRSARLEEDEVAEEERAGLDDDGGDCRAEGCATTHQGSRARQRGHRRAEGATSDGSEARGSSAQPRRNCLPP